MPRIRERLEALLTSGNGGSCRPEISANYESNIKGLYIVGDLAGAPVIKLAMEQGFDIVQRIAGLPELGDSNRDESILDLLVIGAGAAGLNAALAAQDNGLSCVVVEKEKIANTIENFPEGKWVYAEPDSVPPKGKLWLDGATKEDLIKRWQEIVDENDLDVRTEEALETLAKETDGTFLAKTAKGEYRTRKILLATGQRGNPRKLGVPGEESEKVYHRLYSPRKYHGEDILVVGGGNSAIEAALLLSEENKVTISYRKGEFARIFKDNQRKIDRAMAVGRVEVMFNSSVKAFGDGRATLMIGGEERGIPMDHAFVLIGAQPPVKFLKQLGIRMENTWDGSPLASLGLAAATLLGLWLAGGKAFGEAPIVSLQWVGGIVAAAAFATLVISGIRGSRWAWLGVSFLICYSIYGIKYGVGREFWPYRGWGYEAISFFGRPWSFWYTVLYTIVMVVFGLGALKRWGLERRDKFQIWRYVGLLGFQIVFFFLVPEFLFQWAVKYQWVGEKLASDPEFADQAWRSYGIIYAWPLFFYTFFYDPHSVWVVWGVLLTFVILPVFVLFHGKRYCSWICGCGGLAETLGDRWRHLAPKGPTSIRWEWMSLAVLATAIVVTALMLLKDLSGALASPARIGTGLYAVAADLWLVGIIPVTLYPFLGGKVWCRYWCPLAKLMQLASKLFAKLRVSRFHIYANDKCIACNECSRYCQVGIDVMRYALKQEVLDNATSSCIGCGICVTVCPMDTLSFKQEDVTS